MSRNVYNISGNEVGYPKNGRVTVQGNRNNYQYLDSGIIQEATISGILSEEDYSVIASASGTSSSISLPNDGDYLLTFDSTGAFVLDVQENKDGGWDDSYYQDNPATKVTVNSSSGNQSAVVPGGVQYRMDVGTYNNPITMYATRLN